MRQQTLENQLRDMRQLLDEALVEITRIADELDFVATSQHKPEETVREFRQRADEIMAR